MPAIVYIITGLVTICLTALSIVQTNTVQVSSYQELCRVANGFDFINYGKIEVSDWLGL